MGIVNYLTHLGIMIGIYGILSLTLNFQYGFTGLVNFGHVAFFAIGAYASTLLVMGGGTHFLVGLAGAFVAGGIYGLIISLPTGNLKEDYWAIATLAAAEIVRLFFVNEGWIYGSSYEAGPFGIRGIPSPWYEAIPADLYIYFYLGLVAVFLAITYALLNHLSTSPFGRVLKAIREGDDLPKALGKNVFSFKARSMGISGAFAGLAGGLFAHYVSFISPYNFQPIVTFIVWAMIVVGGIGNNLGAIAGAGVVQIFYSSTRFLKDYVPVNSKTLASVRMIVIGLLIVVVMLFWQEGLIREKKKVYETEPKETNREQD